MIVLALGTNLGNRLENLHLAVNALQGVISEIKTSIIYETEAFLLANAPKSWDIPYYNMVVTGKTKLSPEELLGVIKRIERDLGRESVGRWAPRIIDIDIIFYDDLVLKTQNLTIPHKEAINRPFVMVPLYQLMPEFKHPELGHSIEEIVGNFKAYVGTFRKSFPFSPKLMGVLNITDNSFSDGGKFKDIDAAIAQGLKLLDDGAYVLDIGAFSTNVALNHYAKLSDVTYDKPLLSWREELSCLIPVLEAIISEVRRAGKKVKFSIDSFHAEVFKHLLEKYPISFINDVSGAINAELIDIAAASGLKYILMHSIEVPTRINKLIPFEPAPFLQLKSWALERIAMLESKGVERGNIIFDPGIGFDKSPSQCLNLLRNLSEFRNLGVEVLIGHSRKFFMNSFLMLPPAERDLESALISAEIAEYVDYVRVHNVEDAKRAIVASQCLHSN
jgi:2-amino-4-hydroxy-6-hydroxymethyldihydropteridine diphosphokinase/dihydropteroate synthase